MIEWISIEELSTRTGHSVSTLRRYARDRDISYRRKGKGARAELEFHWDLVDVELKALLEVPSRKTLRPADPTIATMVSLLNEVRDELREMKELFPCKS